MKITKTIIAGWLLAGVLATVPASQAVLMSEYVGSFDPGTPANLADELAHLNYLVTNLGPGDTGPDQNYGQNNNKTRDYDRTGSTLDNLPPATGGVNLGGEDVTTVDASGLNYLLGKYGTTSYIWYSATGFDSDESLPATYGGHAISHSDGFNGGGTNIPDAGATMVLFGAGLLGVGALRRRLSK